MTIEESFRKGSSGWMVSRSQKSRGNKESIFFNVRLNVYDHKPNKETDEKKSKTDVVLHYDLEQMVTYG